MARIVSCGEGMLELSRSKGGWGLGFGGDTLNTAIHLARKGHDVAYLTALGSDPFSDELRGKWAAERLDLGYILTHPRRTPGLYAITTDDQGERTFTYWRETSAAREMFQLDALAALLPAIAQCDLFFFSHITLAILPPADRAKLVDLAAHVRANGGKVAFDGNYRARLWSSEAHARAALEQGIAVADIGLPTLSDEQELWGASNAEAVAQKWTALGCGEVVVKLGHEGCRLASGAILAPTLKLEPVDTSGAGDAFDAGYLSARLGGATPEAAARAGHDLAAWTIMRPGAIPPSGS